MVIKKQPFYDRLDIGSRTQRIPEVSPQGTRVQYGLECDIEQICASDCRTGGHAVRHDIDESLQYFDIQAFGHCRSSQRICNCQWGNNGAYPGQQTFQDGQQLLNKFRRKPDPQLFTGVSVCYSGVGDGPNYQPERSCQRVVVRSVLIVRLGQGKLHVEVLLDGMHRVQRLQRLIDWENVLVIRSLLINGCQYAVVHR